MSISRRCFAALAGAAMLAALPAAAQDYPTKPITIVVPFAAGGLTDVLVRFVGDKLSQRLGQPVIADNRPGANGTIGANAVAKAAPDGYTLSPSGGSTFHPALIKNVPFDLFRDFTPITLTAVFPFVLVTNDKVPAKDLKELVAYVKARPGKLNFGSAGANNQLGAYMFLKAAGLEMEHIPYKGGAPASQALLSDEVQLLFDPILTHKANYDAGKVKILAVTTVERSPILPNVPTTAEVGYPAFTPTSNMGFWAPMGTPKPVIDRLNREITTVLSQPDVKEFFMSRAGAVTSPSTPEGLADFIRKDQAFWAAAAKEANYVPES
jgi:tripartite-type tricarboxylate transporter receptor subunit TctC